MSRLEQIDAKMMDLAKEVDALRAENERLREALEKIASCEKRAAGDVVDVARAALSQGQE